MHTYVMEARFGKAKSTAGATLVTCAWQCRCLELTDNNPKYTMYAFGTGYLNVLGQAANLGCSAYLTADCINFIVQMTNGHNFSPLEILLTYASKPYAQSEWG